MRESMNLLTVQLLRLLASSFILQLDFVDYRDAQGRSPKKFLFIFGFMLPCVAIILCYSAIFYRVRQSRQATYHSV